MVRLTPGELVPQMSVVGITFSDKACFLREEKDHLLFASTACLRLILFNWRMLHYLSTESLTVWVLASGMKRGRFA